MLFSFRELVNARIDELAGIVRALGVGEVKLRDWWLVMRREIFSGFVLGIVLGCIGFLRIANLLIEAREVAHAQRQPQRWVYQYERTGNVITELGQVSTLPQQP